jgi:hypothetical protein
MLGALFGDCQLRAVSGIFEMLRKLQLTLTSAGASSSLYSNIS